MLFRYLLLVISLTLPQHLLQALQTKTSQVTQGNPQGVVLKRVSEITEHIFTPEEKKFRSEKEWSGLDDEDVMYLFDSMYQRRVTYPRRYRVLTEQQHALLQAAKNADVKEVDELLEQQVNPNIMDAQGITPLMWSVLRDNSEIFVRLLQARADVNAEDKNGYTALMQAASLPLTPSRKIMAYVLAELSATKLGKASLVAKSHGNSDLTLFIDTLLARRFSTAIGMNDFDRVTQLLAAGADANPKGFMHGRDKTPLMQAAGSYGFTYPHDRFSIIGDSVDVRILQAFIQAGARLDDQDEDGKTALMHAAWAGNNFKAARLLLEAGADSYLRDKYGRQALDWAQRYESRMIADLIEEHQRARAAALIAGAIIEDKIKAQFPVTDIVHGYLMPDTQKIKADHDKILEEARLKQQIIEAEERLRKERKEKETCIIS